MGLIGADKSLAPVTVLGDALPGRLLALVSASSSWEAYARTLQHRGMSLLHWQPLQGQGVCSAVLVEVENNDMPTSQALHQLESIPGTLVGDIEILWTVDQVSLWDKQPPALTLATVASDTTLQPDAGTGITVAVLDTAIPPSMELGSRLLLGQRFISSIDQPGVLPTHGQLVAERIAGQVSGVARAAQIFPLEVCDSEGYCPASKVVQGVCYALNQLNPMQTVLNLSLGGETPNRLVRSVLQYALARGAAVVSSSRGDAPDHFPAAESLSGQVTVGAVRITQGRWQRIGYEATSPSLVAPGHTDRSEVGGSSFSAALVSGALAVLRAECPANTPVQLKRMLQTLAQRTMFRESEAVGAGMLTMPSTPACE